MAVSSKMTGGILVLLTGILILFGSVMSWAVVQSGLGEANRIGTDGDGIVTFAIGVVIMIAGQLILVLANSIWGAGLGFIASFAASIVAFINILDVHGRIGQVQESVAATVGPGLYIVLAASIFCMATILICCRKTGQDAENVTTIG